MKDGGNTPIEGYITLQEAADLLGVSRPTVYRRALAAEQFMNSPEQSVNSNLNSSEQPVNSQPASIVQGKKRYVSRAWVLAGQERPTASNCSTDIPEQFMNSKMNSVNSSRTPVNSTVNSNLDSPTDTETDPLARARVLEGELNAARVEIAALKATIKAQEESADYLKKMLDREQAIRMAAEQRKLTDGGGGLFAWLRRKTRGNA